MRFNPVARTVTLEPTDCRACRGGAAGPGRQFGRKLCAVCGGTGNGKRGKARGCQQCFGRGQDIDFDSTVPCDSCQGDYQGFSFENWCDTAPVEAVTSMDVVLVRQDRDATWNEQWLGANCFWSVTDYGDAWKNQDGDEALVEKVRRDLANDRVQAVKFWTREQYRNGQNLQTMPVPERVFVIVTRGGYSVRTEVPHVTGAVPMNTYAAIFEQ